MTALGQGAVVSQQLGLERQLDAILEAGGVDLQAAGERLRAHYAQAGRYADGFLILATPAVLRRPLCIWSWVEHHQDGWRLQPQTVTYGLLAALASEAPVQVLRLELKRY